jgi:uncharacterized membrane protein YeaQ/YmgE (transglycosylase-associated protein family)
LEHSPGQGVGGAMRLLTPTHAVLLALASTIGLLIFVFGVANVLRGVIWVLVGAVVGWLGSLVLRTRTHQEIMFIILAGALGALAGLLLLGAPISGGGPLEQFLAAVLGSVLVVAVAGVAHGWRPFTRSSRPTELGR